MLPNNVLYEAPGVEASILPPDDRPRILTVDWEYGGVALRDTSKGLMYQVWKANYDGSNVIIEGQSNGQRVVVDIGTDCRYIALAFDRNMNYALAYQRAGTTLLRWYDPSIVDYVTTQFYGVRSPGICLDDKRAGAGNWSDVVLFGVSGTDLVCYNQRERFGVQHKLGTVDAGAEIHRVGMTNGLRVQVEVI